VAVNTAESNKAHRHKEPVANHLHKEDFPEYMANTSSSVMENSEVKAL